MLVWYCYDIDAFALTVRVKATDRPWACWPAGRDNVRDHWNSERVAWHDLRPTPGTRSFLVNLAVASEEEAMEIHEMCFSILNGQTGKHSNTADPWDSPIVTGHMPRV